MSRKEEGFYKNKRGIYKNEREHELRKNESLQKRETQKEITFFNKIKEIYPGCSYGTDDEDKKTLLYTWLKDQRKTKLVKQIEKEYKISWITIRNWADKYDVKVELTEKRKIKRKPNNAVHLNKEDLRFYMKQGYSVNQISKIMDVAPKTVQSQLREHHLIQENENLQDYYKRKGVVTYFRLKKEKHEKEIIRFLRPYYFNAKSFKERGYLNAEDIRKLTAILNTSGLFKYPVLEWKTRELERLIKN